jgi:hypothetical protein
VVSPEAAILDCDIQLGEPQAHVRWFKDGRELYESRKHAMQIDSQVCELKIKDTDYTDGGRYKVEAWNKMGKVVSEARLTVHSKYDTGFGNGSLVALQISARFLSNSFPYLNVILLFSYIMINSFATAP